MVCLNIFILAAKTNQQFYLEKTLNMMYSSNKNHHQKSDGEKLENSLESEDMEDKLDTVEDVS